MEYEALIAGLKILRKLKAKKIAVYGDSELAIKQVKGEFQAKHPQQKMVQLLHRKKGKRSAILQQVNHHQQAR